MPHSHHSHSGQFCKHALGTLEEVIQQAIRLGFVVYGLTEHVPRYRQVDLYPEEGDLSPEDLTITFDAFLVEAHRLQAKYADQITLLVGLETEFITDLDLDGLERILQQHGTAIEYIVGSVHHINETPIDYDMETFDKALASFSNRPGVHNSMETLVSSYLDAQLSILYRFHPEIIGHLDLCRLYNPSLCLRDMPQAWSKVERNVRYAIEYGALFELNAAAFRKGWDCPYPGPDVFELIVQSGGRFALSDDSHGPQAVGLNYHRLYAYLRQVGLKEIWYLQRSTDQKLNAGGRAVFPVQIEGEWWTESFWKDRIDSS